MCPNLNLKHEHLIYQQANRLDLNVNCSQMKSPKTKSRNHKRNGVNNQVLTFLNFYLCTFAQSYKDNSSIVK